MKPTFRNASERDMNDIVQCWQLSFFDTPDFIQQMLEDAELLRSAVVAEYQGHVRSVMFAFDGLTIQNRNASYLYALCTHPEYRHLGLGTSVCRERIKHSIKSGSQIVFLAPASRLLSDWYQQVFQMKKVKKVPSRPDIIEHKQSGICTRISAEEYYSLRTSVVSYYTLQLLKAQDIIYQYNNGGYFWIHLQDCNAIASIFIKEKNVVIQELFCPEYSIPGAVSAIMAYFNTDVEHCQFLECQDESLLACNVSAGAEVPSFYFPYILD